MRTRWFAAFLVVASLIPAAVGATTAPSLSGRIAVDGRVEDYTDDEWVLDATSAFPERDGDSRWGSDRELVRVALTWDARFFYLAVEFRSRGEYAAAFVGGAAGGLANLDGVGAFQRAIDLPGLSPNVLSLAAPGGEPLVAAAGTAHPFQLVDRAEVPAAVRSTIDGHAAFEMAVPWRLLSVRDGVSLVIALTGGPGSGSGDAAPDPRTALESDPGARARLDRRLAVGVDADSDGVPDAGVSPRAIASVATSSGAVAARGDEGLVVRVERRAFAPDRGETAAFTFEPSTGAFEEVEGECTVHALDGRLVRAFAIGFQGPAASASLAWDGRNASGAIVDGGVYVAAFDLEFTVDGARQRARARTGIAVVR